MEKRFDEWNELKKQLEKNSRMHIFHEKEIWWYAAGENIGSEVSGKNVRFSRPILILRKYGNASFFGIPLSTQYHEGRWYEYVLVKGEMRTVMLSQAGSFSSYRLYERIDRISPAEHNRICRALTLLLFKK